MEDKLLLVPEKFIRATNGGYKINNPESSGELNKEVNDTMTLREELAIITAHFSDPNIRYRKEDKELIIELEADLLFHELVLSCKRDATRGKYHLKQVAWYNFSDEGENMPQEWLKVILQKVRERLEKEGLKAVFVYEARPDKTTVVTKIISWEKN